MSSITKELLFFTPTNTTITKNFDTLTFPSNSITETNTTRLDLNGFYGLRGITIGDNNFPSINKVEIIGIQTLLSISVGRNSFTRQLHARLLSDDDTQGSFVIADCPQFYSLSIGPYSFSQFTSFNASSKNHSYS